MICRISYMDTDGKTTQISTWDDDYIKILKEKHGLDWKDHLERIISDECQSFANKYVNAINAG